MTIPTRHEVIYLCLAIRDAYLAFDQEDWCDTPEELFKNNGVCDCGGCIQYKNLIRAYKIAKKYLPKIREIR